VDSREKPLYQVIVDDLMKQINSNKLVPGDRIPTELELSEQFKVSRITAMRAVKELERKNIVFRKKARGTFVNEREAWVLPVGMEKRSSPHALSVLSIVMPFAEQFGYEILRGAERAAQDAGYYITFHNSMNNPAREREIVQHLSKDGINGIVLYPCRSSGNIDVISDLLIRRCPIVLIDRKITGLRTPGVVSNNDQGGYDVAAHLTGLGHRKIAFLGRDLTGAVSASERYSGYCQALIDAGIPLQQEWVIDTLRDFPDIEEGHPDYQDRIDNAVLDRWLGMPNRPTAIVALNDVTALLFIKKATGRGIRIPEQLSVTGFDNLQTIQMSDILLTTVEQSFFQMGETAVKMLVEQIDTGSIRSPQVILDTKLIVRNSSAPPRE